MDPKLSNSLANFAVNFCNALGQSKTTICSPLSAETVLGLLALGCADQSRAELLKVLDIPDDEALRSSFAYLTSTLQSIEGVTLNMANKIYLKEGGQLKAQIKKDAAEVFQSSFEQVDFTECEFAAGVINKWVEEKTNGLIKNIVSAESFDDETRLVLVNAIYFKGNWLHRFSVTSTRNTEFQVNNSTTIKVPMMCKFGVRFKYGVIPELKARIVKMKYQGNQASMVIVLPDEIEGLNSVLQQLAAGHDLMADIEALKYKKVDVLIPKFKVEMKIDLKELLPKLGIQSIFDKKKSDIDMLTSHERLFVSEAVQKAFIVVEETGTEAAACTAMSFVKLCDDGQTPPLFVADRPFLYLLTARKIPLFIGVYEGSQFRIDLN